MKPFYKKKNHHMPESESFDLDLAPMLALMVTLIPIMLLSTVFVHVKVIETPLPQVVQQAIDKDQNKKDRTITLYLDMSSQSGFSLKALQNGRSKILASIPKTSEGWNFSTLHAEFIKVKQKHPDVFQLNLTPNADVSYEDIVKVIDEARAARAGEPRFRIKAAQVSDQSQTQNRKPASAKEQAKEKSNLVETEVMFPNVIFANVVEG